MLRFLCRSRFLIISPNETIDFHRPSRKHWRQLSELIGSPLAAQLACLTWYMWNMNAVLGTWWYLGVVLVVHMVMHGVDLCNARWVRLSSGIELMSKSWTFVYCVARGMFVSLYNYFFFFFSTMKFGVWCLVVGGTWSNSMLRLYTTWIEQETYCWGILRWLVFAFVLHYDRRECSYTNYYYWYEIWGLNAIYVVMWNGQMMLGIS